jgi:hypothetical protein
MKSLKQVQSILIFTIISFFLLNCSTKEDNQISTFEASTDEKLLSDFLNDYYEIKYTAFTGKTNKNGRTSNLSFNQFTENPELISNLKNDLEHKQDIENGHDLKIFNSKVQTKIKNGINNIDGNKCSLKVEICYYYLRVNPNDESEQVESAGYDIFDLLVEKDSKGKFKILKEELDKDFRGKYEIAPPKIKDVEVSKSMRGVTGSFDRLTAKKWAIDNVWKPNQSGYVDYSYEGSGGDCTNFLSWSLYKGGWVETNNWFFHRDGSSCSNMSTCSRSPSWTGANQFNQYILGPGSTRVSNTFKNISRPWLCWFGLCDSYYSKIKKLELGDIVQLGSDGNMGHSMIVTWKTTSKPYIYVTYRNAYGYSAYVNATLDEISAKQFGYKVTGTY